MSVRGRRSSTSTVSPARYMVTPGAVTSMASPERGGFPEFRAFVREALSVPVFISGEAEHAEKFHDTGSGDILGEKHGNGDAPRLRQVHGSGDYRTQTPFKPVKCGRRRAGKINHRFIFRYCQTEGPAGSRFYPVAYHFAGLCDDFRIVILQAF